MIVSYFEAVGFGEGRILRPMSFLRAEGHFPFQTRKGRTLGVLTMLGRSVDRSVESLKESHEA
jgi:hypothetical protein